MRDRDKKFNIDWKKIGQVLAQAASEAVNSPEPAEYQGLNLYGSYGLTDSGKKRKEWATKVIAVQPGVNVNMVPRQQKKNYPQCPKCHIRVRSCPKCEADMRGTEEKGVDVRMATDMIKWAVNDNYDVAVLVSSDGDFAPVAEFLATRGIKVVHGAFPRTGRYLSSHCWARIDVFQLRNKFRFQK